WIFSQAVDRVEPPNPVPGERVTVRDSAGSLIGCGYYNPATTIAVRMLAWGEVLAFAEIIERRLTNALALRARFISDDTDCYRLINGDGDGLSGTVVDRYGDILVVQLLTAGADRMRSELTQALIRYLAPRSIFERSRGAVRKQEGLPDSMGVLAGEPVPETTVVENGLKITVDFEQGQKTGYFLDQRENRLLVRNLAKGTRVLDAYCYAAGFSMAALSGGASRVTALDTSAQALEWGRRNLESKSLAGRAVELVHADALEYMAKTNARFDLIILDPPPLARTRGDRERAGRMYVELNARAMKLLAPGGHLMTFSCSQHFVGEDFVRAVRIAQTAADRKFRTLRRLGPGPDHPMLLGHPEGEYLTGLLLRDLS
ncbi:MAG TPA: class I SAM-dependent rRNA methyltransferase, partial [Candidatus Binataceae bacterium]